MITHRYRTTDIDVTGGSLRVGIWDPIEVAEGADVPSALLVHGITSSHMAWPLVVSKLPRTRLIAPDLRGRGMSRDVQGPAGMRAHATDLVCVLDALDIDSLPVVGHSMGAFVAVVLAHVAPQRVSRLELLDGGVPLDTPPGLTPDELVAAVLGPTAERLAMRFDNVAGYLQFWRSHPAFGPNIEPEVAQCFAYDLVPDGPMLRPATSLAVTTDDSVDLNHGTAIFEAADALEGWGRPVRFVTVPRGLQDETPGLYDPQYLDRVLVGYPTIDHVMLDDLNHYTLIMSEHGAVALGGLLGSALA